TRGGAGGYVLREGGWINVGANGVKGIATGAVPATSATTLATTGPGHNIVLAGGNVGNTASQTTLTSAGNISGTVGVVQGTAVILDGAGGVGTSPAARVNTAAGTLTAHSANGGVFVSEADTVALASNGGLDNLAGGVG